MRIDHGKYRISIEYGYVLVLVHNICKLIILH